MQAEYYLDSASLGKVLQLLKFFNDSGRSTFPTTFTFPDDVTSFLNSLPSFEWQIPLNIATNIYGSVTKNNNEMCIFIYGVNANAMNIPDCLKMPFLSDFYGLDTGVSDTIGRLYIAIHYNMQSLLITFPDITKITIVADSYGGAISQAMSIILQKMLMFHKNTISDGGRSFISNVYSQYLIPHLNAILGENSQDPILNEVRSEMLINPTLSFLQTVEMIDKDLFSRLELNQVLSFGMPNSLPISILDDPDLGLKSSIADFDAGNRQTGDFFSKVFCFIGLNDPVANIFTDRMPLGKLVSIVNWFRSRILIGQICVLPQTDIMHSTFLYCIYIYDLYRQNSTIPIYTYQSVPNPYPFPLIRLSFVAYRLIVYDLTFINVILLIIAFTLAVLIEVVIPVAFFVGIIWLGFRIKGYFA